MGGGVLINLVLAACATTLAALFTPLVGVLARQVGAIDRPGHRRVHQKLVPRLGGVAVLVAVLGALLTAAALGFGVFGILTSRGGHLGWLLAGTLVVTAIGAVDDVWSLTPASKLTGHIVGAALALAGGYAIRAVTNPFTGTLIDLGPLGSVVTLLWIVGITNAFNLIDGLDGLAAGVGFIVALTVCILGFVQDRPDAALLAATLAGALLGFLFHNFHPASVFLGDSGAYLLGYSLSVLSIQGLQKGPTVAVLLVPILALGFPIIETLVTIQRRMVTAGSKAVMTPDDDHIHHRLLTDGLTHRQAVLLLYGICAGLAALACVAVVIGGPGSAVIVVVVAIACYAGLRRLHYFSR